MMSARSMCALALLLLGAPPVEEVAAQQEKPVTWRVSSPAFLEGGRIPINYTCEGANSSPPLTWTAPPPATNTLALIVDDPDAPAGHWVHWVLYNLPVDTNGIPARLPTQRTLPTGASQGMNDFGQVGYGGPCPPPRASHRYVFTLYALDIRLTFPTPPTKQQLEQAMQRHVLGQTRLIGTYQR